MDSAVHTLSELFRQLGLADRPAEIAAFLRRHRPLPAKMMLADAPFWTPAQATLLREQLLSDADWATLGEADAIVFGTPTRLGTHGGRGTAVCV